LNAWFAASGTFLGNCGNFVRWSLAGGSRSVGTYHRGCILSLLLSSTLFPASIP
jgi:hypothetical protein